MRQQEREENNITNSFTVSL